MAEKTRLDHLQESQTEELIEELLRRRRLALSDCSVEELERELKQRGVEMDCPPRLVEK